MQCSKNNALNWSKSVNEFLCMSQVSIRSLHVCVCVCVCVCVGVCVCVCVCVCVLLFHKTQFLYITQNRLTN